MEKRIFSILLTAFIIFLISGCSTKCGDKTDEYITPVSEATPAVVVEQTPLLYAEAETPETTPFSFVAEGQSQIPYLGIDEILPLFGGRNTIGDWISDITEDSVLFKYYMEEASAYTRLDISCTHCSEHRIASFYIENYWDVEDVWDFNYEILPDEILALEISVVLYLDFETMGIPYNIRGITAGSHADDVKKAFLNMRREPVHVDNYTLYSMRELYNLYDIDPNADVGESTNTVRLQGGMEYESWYPASLWYIAYYHIDPYTVDGELYSPYGQRSNIRFELDRNGTVVRFTYSDPVPRH